MDTTGMRCTCGKKLVVTNKDDGGCVVLACPNKKCEKSYRTPIIPGTTLPFPWETMVVKPYFCKKCKRAISEEQAKTTFSDFGKATCSDCV